MTTGMTTGSKVNRVLLAPVGLVLLGGGLVVIAAGLDVYRHWHLTPPAGWPLTTRHDVLITRADQTRWADQGWWWPTVIAALAVLTLLALWWLLSQPRRRPRRMAVGGTPSQEGVELSDHALSDALAADAARLPGVQRARVHLAGRPACPQALITLTLAPGATPRTVLTDLRLVIERARRSTGWERFPSQTRLRVARHGARRAE